MTSKVDLLSIATSPKYLENPAIKAIATAVAEATGQQRNWLARLEMAIGIVRHSMERNVFYASTDDTIQQSANEHAMACAKANTLFLTLACALQALGEPIEY